MDKDELIAWGGQNTLNCFLSEGRTVDFLSVDAEGVDLDVLKSNDWSVDRPTLVMVEMNNQLQEIVEFFNQEQYLLVFNNEYNSVFVDTRTSDSRIKASLEKIYDSRRLD